MRPLGPSCGFSLIELATVLAVTGTLAALAVPVVSTLRAETGLASAQREVMSALRLARGGAMASNAPRSVVVTPPTLIAIQNQSGVTTYYTRNLNVYGSGMSVSTSNSSSPVTITYDARGLLSPANPVTLTIQNSLSQTKTVTILPTGKATAN